MNSNKINNPKSLWMMVFSLLIFGSIGVFRRSLPLPSAFLAFARGLLGSAMLFAFLLLTRRGIKKGLSRRSFGLLALTGAVIGVNWMLLFEAFNRTTVAVATLCYYMQPTVVVLLSPLFFKEKLTVRKAVCAAVAVFGMALVSGVVGGSQGATPGGVLFGLGAAVCYAAVVILNKRLGGIDVYQKTAVQLFFAGLVTVPYLLLTGGFGGIAWSGSTALLLLVIGVIHTGLAYLLYFGSMDGLRAQTVAMLSYIDPVAALLFSALFLHEPLGAAGIVGAVLIIGSALVSEIEIKKRQFDQEGG